MAELPKGKALPAGEEPAVVLLKVIRDLAAEIHPRKIPDRPLTLDISLDRDLALDSLARVELLVRIEKVFRVTLPERIFADAETPRDLLRALASASLSGDVRAAAVIPSPEEPSLPEPLDAGTLIEVLDWHVRAHPDRSHIRFYDEDAEAITYRRLREGAAAVAAGLQNHGLQPGEPVAIMLPTGRDYFFAYMGILLAGGVPVPVYPPVRIARIEDHLRRHSAILNNCGASTLIIIPEVKRFARILQSLAENLRNLVTVEELSSPSGPRWEPLIRSRDIAFLQYTSGSTGVPKGVILTHENILANIRAMGLAAKAGSSDVFISWLPLYHDMGLIGAWLGSLYFGALLVIMSPLAFIARPRLWLWAIHRHRGTLSAAPNFAYEFCLKRLKDEDLEGLDLSSWRAAFNGAEPVSPETVERFYDRFEKYGFQRTAMTPVYGLAENTVGLAFPPLGRGPLIDRIQRDPFIEDGLAVPAGEKDGRILRFASCGRPLPGHEIRIVGPDGLELPERQEGRLQFRGPSASSGYFRNAEETARLFHDGWLDSGDKAYLANGEVYITGRVKDIIIRAGRNIYPQELEEAVGAIPGIRKGNVVVFGTADPASGTERLVILAETRESAAGKLDALRSEINTLAVELIGTPVDEVVLAPPGTVLKTSSGKIRRSANRDLYERGPVGAGGRMLWLQLASIALSGIPPLIRRLRRTASAWIYAGYAWTLFGLTAFSAAAVFLIPRPPWRWSFLHRLNLALARAAFVPLSVKGVENLPAGRPVILVANHESYIDPFVLLAALPLETSFVAKAELSRRPLIDLFLRRIGTEYVERFDKEKVIEDARRVMEAARGNRSLMIFPEGTFSRAPGLLPFHLGAFVAAARSGRTVVPVAIRGTRYVLRGDSWFPRRGAIAVTVGKPLSPEEEKGEDEWATALRLRDLARGHILRYCGEPDQSGW